MKNIGGVYLISEIGLLLFGLIDHYWIHRANSIVFKYIGELVTVLSCIGLLIGIILLISWMRKNLETNYFIRQIILIIIGIVLPFIFLYSMLSQLH
jgi:hypothetical protein